ncbi:MAG: GNAT family N-acetyltransferase [Candidatus Omnitrophica bacterium]|nr:GNAT family N-acetyltransferase [Candidatus Omnitrophota bacterium]
MIRGEKVILRALEDRDVEHLRIWRNHPDLMKYHFSDLPVSEAGQRRWYENYAGDSGAIVFIIENEDQTQVGYTILKNLDYKNRQAEVGLYLDPAQQGKGYGKDAFLSLMQFGFYELNLHRMFLKVFAFNERAIHMYEQLGFKKEGRMREAFFSQCQFHDIVIMSILESEFLE